MSMDQLRQGRGLGEVVGYARQSTADQRAGLDAQIAELKAAGCTKLFSEVVSGIDAARPQLQACLSYLREGDTFIVRAPCRLARSSADLLRIVDDLTARGVRVILKSMGVDTTTSTGKLMLTILAGVVEHERTLMLERQRAGVARAKAEGKYKGRKPTARLKAPEIRQLRASGRTVPEIVVATGVSRASVFRVLADRGSCAA